MPAIVSFFSSSSELDEAKHVAQGGKDEPWQRNPDKALFSSN